MEAVTFFGIDVGFLGAWWVIIKPYLKTINPELLVLAVTVSYGIFKWWRTLERNMVARLDSFLDHEHEKLKTVRKNIRTYRANFGTPFLGKIDTAINPPLKDILKKYQSSWPYSLFNIENELERALDHTDVRLKEASDFVERHSEQKAVAYILLGASLARRGKHRKALDQFEEALGINEDDIEALDYAGNQLLKLREREQAIEKFDRVIQIAESMFRLASESDNPSETRTEADLLIARAHRGKGLAFEIPANHGNEPNYGLAYDAYTEAKDRFPKKNGPGLDFADIHLLRGEVAIELSRWNEAMKSLRKASDRFDELVEEGGEYAEMAKIGKSRVRKALKHLKKRQREASLPTNVPSSNP